MKVDLSLCIYPSHPIHLMHCPRLPWDMEQRENNKKIRSRNASQIANVLTAVLSQIMSIFSWHKSQSIGLTLNFPDIQHIQLAKLDAKKISVYDKFFTYTIRKTLSSYAATDFFFIKLLVSRFHL